MSHQRGGRADWWGMGGVGEAWIEGSGHFRSLLQYYSSALSAHRPGLCPLLRLGPAKTKLHFVSLFMAAFAFPTRAVVQRTLNSLPF